MNETLLSFLPMALGAVFYLFLAFIINKLIKGQSPLHEQSKKIFINWNKFKGVANRADFIVGTLLYASFMMAFATILFPILTVNSGDHDIEHYSVLIVFIIVTIFLTVSFLSLQIRRFHDGNVSGWVYLLLTVLTIIFSIMAEEFEIKMADTANSLIGIAFLYFLFFRETRVNPYSL